MIQFQKAPEGPACAVSRGDVKRSGQQAAAGFEPANNGFANRRLRPLGYAANARLTVSLSPACPSRNRISARGKDIFRVFCNIFAAESVWTKWCKTVYNKWTPLWCEKKGVCPTRQGRGFIHIVAMWGASSERSDGLQNMPRQTLPDGITVIVFTPNPGRVSNAGSVSRASGYGRNGHHRRQAKGGVR
jgi:hypothetical protein